ncbi:hypothetical protein [Streptomyces collinus]|uniref:hypothetical protein n=1 Tax=Streptomyces collinus TaxID=42684 RepID=UPI002941D6EA|nr:hypothetical protein [Streptomyces collinus]
MTLPAAPFGTAVRVLRTAAGRRALQLTLVVAGLFVLGFLCGEQAHAAEGAPTTVTGRVTTPVRDVVRTASGALEDTRAEAPTLPAVPPVHLPTLPPPPTTHLPTLPHLPAVPHLPTLPHLPPTRLPSPPVTPVPAPRPTAAPLPKRPEGSRLPAQSLPAAPAAPASRPDRNGGTAAAAGPHRVGGEARTAAVGPRPSATAYGPHVTRPAARASEAPARASGQPATAPVALPAGAPAPPRPTGDPDGVLGKQAADAPAPRHGDGRAVAPDGRAPLRLLPAGTVARTDAPRTRERHRDVPVFPG